MMSSPVGLQWELHSLFLMLEFCVRMHLPTPQISGAQALVQLQFTLSLTPHLQLNSNRLDPLLAPHPG